MKLTRSTFSREFRPMLAAIVQSALRLNLHLTPEERKGLKGQLKLTDRKESR